jgi:hypothetical protein
LGYRQFRLSPPYVWYWGWDNSNCNPETGLGNQGQSCVGSLPNPGRFPFGPFGGYRMTWGYESVPSLLDYINQAGNMRIDEDTVGKPIWLTGPIFATSDGASYVKPSVKIECTPTYIATIPIWKEQIGPYLRWIQELASATRNHPNLKFITITHGIDGEGYFIRYEDCKNALKAKIAADPSFPNPLEGIDAYVKSITDAYYQNFCDGVYDPGKQICHGTIKPLFVQSTTFNDAAGKLGQYMPPLGIKFSAFTADTPDAVFYSNYYRGYGTVESFVRYRNLIPTSIEPRYGNFLLGQEQGTYWFGLEAVWIRPTTIDINPSYGLWGTRQEDPEYFSLISDHMNVNAVTTPDVWIAFRDTDNLCGAKTQEEYDHNLCVLKGGQSSGIRGDFDFFLRRPDNIPSAKTVLLSRNGYTKDLYSAEIPASAQTHKFARYVRRTDKATCDHYMFFDVDNDYPWAGKPGQSFLVSISFLDLGRGDFFLEYKSSQGNLVRVPVHREDSKTWKTVKVTIEDAYFNDNMGLGNDGQGSPTYTDFRIYNGGDASPDVYLHMVKVKGLGTKPTGPKRSTEILCQTPSTSVSINESPEIIARLKDSEGNPLPNRMVRYALSPFWYTNRIFHARTDGEGTAVTSLNLANTPPLPSSRFIHEVEVTFPGDPDYYASRAICFLPTNYPNVTKRSIRASITPTIARVGDTVTVTVQASNGKGSYNVEGEGFGMTACYGTLDSNGKGSCSFRVGGMAIEGERVLGVYVSPDGGYGAAGTHLVLKILPEEASPPPVQYTLGLRKMGTGSGSISGPGINCGGDCHETYSAGTTLTLTAKADPGSVFAGWSGEGCSGTGPCTLIMNSNKTITAQFSSTVSPPTTPAAVSASNGRTDTSSQTMDKSLPVFALNCGGAEYIDKSGIVYQGDRNFSGGSTYTTTHPIDGSDDDRPYQSERWGTFSYHIPVPNGKYHVVLKFAEIYSGILRRGQRVFTVKIEGKEAIANLDLYATVGSYKALDITIPVNVTDGVLNIEFISLASHAKVNAIIVKSTASDSPPTITATAGIGGTVTPKSQSRPQYSLKVKREGSGGGIVVQSPPGEKFPSGSTVTLSAISHPGSIFAGWSGECNGSSPQCLLEMNGDKNISALFLPLSSEGTQNGNQRGTVVDLDGDGMDDVVWFDERTGHTVGWYLRNGRFSIQDLHRDVNEAQWVMAGGGNLRPDGSYNIFWHNQTTGKVYAWSMNRGVYWGEHYIHTVEDLRWKLAGVGDFDGDGNVDLLWHHQEFGLVYIWFMKGVNFIRDQYVATVEDVRWQVVGVGDLNGDGKAEVLWQHPEGGPLYIWYMDGARWLRDQYVRSVEDLNWKVVGIGRFSDSRQANILWKHQVSGEVYIWFLERGGYRGDRRIPVDREE